MERDSSLQKKHGPAEQSDGPGPPDRRQRARTNAGFHLIQLIERLLVISALCGNPNIRVAPDQAIHKIGRDPALATVLENEPSPGTPRGTSALNSNWISPCPSLSSFVAGKAVETNRRRKRSPSTVSDKSRSGRSA
jgi:hypothetical protein